MIHALPETISLYSSASRATVSSLIRDMRLEKTDLNFLVTKMSNMTFDLNYTGAKVASFSLLTKEAMVDAFRNAYLRMQNLFNAANATGIALNSIVSVFDSEIQKVEEDLDKLQVFIDNYEFISGKDDLFNANYIEKFDSFLNDYRADGIQFSIPDRDGQDFSETNNAFIDPVSGTLKIGKGQDIKNIIRNVKSIKIATNYNNYTTTNSSFENLFNDNFFDSWSVTVKSPAILSAQLKDYIKYFNYDYSAISGAIAAVEITLQRPINIDTIRFQPNQSTNFKLLQAVVYHNSPLEANNITPSENYTVLLNNPVLLNRVFDLRFNKKSINKIIFIFNQQDYVKNNRPPINSELNSKVLDSFVKAVIDDRKNRFSKFQDIIYWFFKRKSTVKGISKNKKTDIDYYAYRFPQEFDSYINNLDQQIKEFNNLIIEDRNVFTNTPVFVNAINSMLNTFSGKYKIFDSDKYIEGITAGSSLFASGFIMGSSSNGRSTSAQQYDSGALAAPLTSISSQTSVLESNLGYEYSFSLKSIEFIETLNDNVNKAVFVSKKIPVNGQVVAAKIKPYFFNNNAGVASVNRSILAPASYELSLSNKPFPSSESDWIPISSYGNTFVQSEILFTNNITRKGTLRFRAKNDSITLYKDGVLVPRVSANYTYSVNENSISISESIFNINSRFIVSYDLDFSLSPPDEVDFIKKNIILQSLKNYSTEDGSGEIFSSTNLNASVRLSYAPYVDRDSYSRIIYNKSTGTNFISNNAGYNPVRIVLSDGTVAVNLTNYSLSAEKVSFYSTTETLFIQSGRNVVFNRVINQPFTVYYQYIPNDLRFRLIVRKNIIDLSDPISVDSVILKMKTINNDPYYEKLNSLTL
jgi:hypothetical protein